MIFSNKESFQEILEAVPSKLKNTLHYSNELSVTKGRDAAVSTDYAG